MVSNKSIEFVVALLAIVSLGARVAPLNPALTWAELSDRLSALSAHALVASKHQADKLGLSDPIAGSAGMWIVSIEGSGSASAVRIWNGSGQSLEPGPITETSLPMINREEVALVMFTAGSTSAPKAVPLTHRNIIASILDISLGYDLSPSDATLIVMPLSHGHGLVAGLLV